MSASPRGDAPLARDYDATRRPANRRYCLESASLVFQEKRDKPK